MKDSQGFKNKTKRITLNLVFTQLSLGKRSKDYELPSPLVISDLTVLRHLKRQTDVFSILHLGQAPHLITGTSDWRSKRLTNTMFSKLKVMQLDMLSTTKCVAYG